MKMPGYEQSKMWLGLHFVFLMGVFILLVGAAPGPLWAAAAPPRITEVQRTADGYMLIGTGFGNDRARVQVFEGNTQVPTASVTYVADGVIAVRSQPNGTVQHRVVAAGQSSNLFSFNHPVAASAPPARPNITSVTPNSGNQGTTVDVTISGTNLTGARVALGVDKKVVPTVLPGGTATSLRVRLSIAADALPGPRTLEVTTAGGTTATPFTVLQAAAFRPKSITTGELTMTGLRPPPFRPKSVTTGELTMTGLRFQPKAVTTSELTMTGLRFQPKSITTSELTMTGLRFQPKNITTGEITMTGLRFQPKNITTSELTMTGLRFQSKNVTTGELTMTGLRE